MEQKTGNISEIANIRKSLEAIASEMCDHYCKFPDDYAGIEFEDEATERLSEEHCNNCPLVQFLI